MKICSTFIVNFALTASRKSKIQPKGGATFQHLALSKPAPHHRGLRRPARLSGMPDG
jgi:hypothetical protein